MKRRVVITGVGLVTPLGIGRDHVWSRLIEGASGAGPITTFEASDLPCRIGCLVPRVDGRNGGGPDVPGSFDPDKVMKDVAQPVLILQGSLDTQVPPSNADKLETSAKARKKGGAVDVVRVQGVNHLLVAARSGEVDEYARLSAEKVSPDVIAALTNWLSKTLSQKP